MTDAQEEDVHLLDRENQFETSVQEFLEKESDVIDLTNDDLEVHIPVNVHFSKKIKTKKWNKRHRKKSNEMMKAVTANSIHVPHTFSGENKSASHTLATDANSAFHDSDFQESNSQRSLHLDEQKPSNANNFLSHLLLTRKSGRAKKMNYNDDNSKMFPCQKCGQSFETPEELIDHLYIHEQEPGSFLCVHAHCSRSFQNKRGLQTHARLQHKGCKCCCKTVPSLTKPHRRRTHRNSVAAGGDPVFKGIQIEGESEVDKRFLCEVCGKRYSADLYLKRHKVMHSSNRKFGCDNCGQVFTTEAGLNAHVDQHLTGKGEQLFSHIRCPDAACGLYLPSMKTYKFHAQQHAVSRYPCPQCGNCFSEWGNLLRHLKIHLGLKDHECTECGRKFTDKVSLISHVRRSHSGERPYHCDQCPRSFVMKSDLNRHKIRHSNLRKHTCMDCNKEFKTRCSLLAHMRRKSGEKTFQCGVCSKRFGTRSGLKMHMMTHSKLKLYQCETCYKQFSYKISLIAHMRTHTGAMPYLCRICDKRFSHPSNRTRHEKTVHANQHT